jgi:2-oxo-4-hydroxy-4-carboxy-5-ureidoimidazoline decarboxylase
MTPETTPDAGRPEAWSLGALNELPEPEARLALAACCESEHWIRAVLAGRPYSSQPALAARSDAAVAAMSTDDLRQALAGHPRIGDRRADSAGWSGQEQAGVPADDAALAQALADGNAAYERRFGHIYLVCATGRTGAELLALLRDRLGNDPEQEWAAVARELAKINRIRLAKLLGAAS